jgi:cytochrome c553
VRAIVCAVGSLLLLAAWVPPSAPPRARPGWPLYERLCLPCHGADGTGRGPAAPFTRSAPRDLVRADYAWRSTPLGQPPTRADLALVIRHGAPGTSMPAFALPAAAVDQLVEVVQAFAPGVFGPSAPPPAPLPIAAAADPRAPAPAADAARGAALWRQHGCAECHGAEGRGDTPAARALARPPSDLTREPLRRPRASDDPAGRRRAALLSIATGLASGAMPGYAGALSAAELWALADHVVALGARVRTGDRGRAAALAPAAIAADRVARLPAGTWPGGGDPAELAVFGGPIALQGAPSPALGPAQASLHPQQCARCHAKQAREWGPSLHAGASSPGLAAQMYDLPAERRAACLRCHAPLPEQLADPDLRATGVGCASCHVRGGTRHGPPGVAPSLRGIPGYPFEPLALYERGDFCLPCHQLPPRTALAGKPLLDTYREWLEGPYMPRGVQCQHCHMPNREHTFLGIHDADTFRQGVRLTARARRGADRVTVVADLANVGAGHYLPTTPTPAVWLAVELVDGTGRAIPGARAVQRIGRDIFHDGERWHERADTRIPPGEQRTVARAWRGAAVAAAARARVTVEVHPDDYYDRLYVGQLAGALPPAQRALYERALAQARRSRYVALRRDVPIERGPAGDPPP